MFRELAMGTQRWMYMSTVSEYIKNSKENLHSQGLYMNRVSRWAKRQEEYRK
jgi:hypothetical protein